LKPADCAMSTSSSISRVAVVLPFKSAMLGTVLRPDHPHGMAAFNYQARKKTGRYFLNGW
jgi:hypothetical protein